MKKIVYTVGTIIVGTFLLGLTYYYYVWNEHGDEQQNSIAVAEQEYGISEVMDINHYYGSYAAYDVIHAKKEGEERIIFVPLDKNGDLQMIDGKEGWDRNKVKQYVRQELSPDRLVSIRLGLEKFRETSPFIPVWEIVYEDSGSQYTFHYIRYDDGTHFKTYKMKKS
ncbi:hypothetical protein [Pseudalkalibacillus sp. SCS-8]|uniref:hypothetical protein n=1 Tax=Pseudalkalibacillus nanhaiensis TaxID=3115291 RepID=UPI0032D9F5FF